jgi:hypothetical protein
VVLGLLGVVVTAQLAIAASTGAVRVAVDPFALDAPTFRALAPLFPDYEAWTPHTVATHLAWTAAWIAGAALLLRADRRRASTPREAAEASTGRAPTARVLRTEATR